jgi:lipopolysaccharide/colanic/teichoic acid biosynthesis glycosyltransferase
LNLIQSAKWLGVRVSLMPTIMTVVGVTTTVDQLDSLVLLGVSRFGLSRSSAALKRTLDLVLGGIVLVLVSPLMAAIAIAVKLTSPGPALFKQERIGHHAKPFTIYKFRSMVNDAEQLKSDLSEGIQMSGLFKLVDDPRITKVGKVLRKTYLDELPQLFNVMRGEMSLVGPRPLIESGDALLTGYDRHRLRLIPGMTGPWQLRGPIKASLAELARLDYLYASNWSVWADIDILLGTAGRVLKRHGH